VFLEVTRTPDSAVTGIVRDDATGEPIDQAQVGLLGEPFDQFTTTGIDGAFHFDTYSGTYTLAVSALGYLPVTVADVVAVTGMTTTRAISLTAFSVELHLGKTATPARVSPGDLLTYTLTLTNGSAVSTTHVVVTDALPAHTAFAWASDGGAVTDGVVTWGAPVLFPYRTLSRTLVVTVTSAPAGTLLAPLVNAIYGARSDQALSPVWGLPVAVTVVSSLSNHIYLPAILRDH
jgi:uncharacterized repeat protein (TIGR01451 family)